MGSYIDTPHPSFGPEGYFCCVKGCTNFGTKKPPGVTFHKFPEDVAKAQEWVQIVRENSLRSDEKDRPLSGNSIICSEHFRECDIDRTSGSRPCIKEGALPTIFPPVPKYFKGKHTIIRKIPIRKESKVDCQQVYTSAGNSSNASVTSQETRRTPCISEVEGHMYKVSHNTLDEDDSDDSNFQCEILTVDATDGNFDQAAMNSMDEESSPPTKKRGRPRAKVQTVVPPTSEILYNVLAKTDNFRSSLPPNWHRIVHVAGANGCIIFTCYESNKQEGSLPVCVREVFVDRACRVYCFVGGTRIDLHAFSICDDLNTLGDVVGLVAAVDALRLCKGALSADECSEENAPPGAHLDLDLMWRADDCPQVLKGRRSCDGCIQMRKMFMHRLRKARQAESSGIADNMPG